jgi:cytochrome P450
MLGDRVEALAEQFLAGSGGRVDVVELVRNVTFAYLSEYLGVPEPPDGSLALWGTRLFEYQFVASDPPLVVEVESIAPRLRSHIQDQIERRRGEQQGTDDVLGRCMKMQAQGVAGFTDDKIRTDLMGLIVGGPPQPPMVVPQAMEQLLRRPPMLAQAQAAARAGDDNLLLGFVLEAMRFDPLAPGLPRTVLAEWTIAKGTGRQSTVRPGATVIAAFASAMRDKRRVPEPERFNPRRLPYEYMHFGYALHQCFGIHLNHATLHRMIKPLLRRKNLRRAPGPIGRLRKAGAFAQSLCLEFEQIDVANQTGPS